MLRFLHDVLDYCTNPDYCLSFNKAAIARSFAFLFCVSLICQYLVCKVT